MKTIFHISKNIGLRWGYGNEETESFVANAGIDNFSHEAFVLDETISFYKINNVFDAIVGWWPISPNSLASAAINVVDSANNITWANDDGNRHSEQGVTGDGISFHGKTQKIPTALGLSNTNYGVVIGINSNVQNGFVDYGHLGTGGAWLVARNTSNQSDFRFGNSTKIANTTSIGRFMYTRTLVGATRTDRHWISEDLKSTVADATNLAVGIRPYLLSLNFENSAFSPTVRRTNGLILFKPQGLTQTQIETISLGMKFYNDNIISGGR